MNIIAWIVIGGLAGWLASMVMGTNDQQGCLMDVVIGIIGAIVGGFLLGLVGFGGDGFIPSLFTAFLGAVVVLFGKRQLMS